MPKTTSDAVKILDKVFVKGDPERRAAIDKEKALLYKQYTPEQIEEFCTSFDSLKQGAMAGCIDKDTATAIQIIRQLQQEVVEAEKERDIAYDDAYDSQQ